MESLLFQNNSIHRKQVCSSSTGPGGRGEGGEGGRVQGSNTNFKKWNAKKMSSQFECVQCTEKNESRKIIWKNRALRMFYVVWFSTIMFMFCVLNRMLKLALQSFIVLYVFDESNMICFSVLVIWFHKRLCVHLYVQ